LLETMFDLPSLSHVESVVVDAGVISSGNRPLVVYAEQAAAGSA